MAVLGCWVRDPGARAGLRGRGSPSWAGRAGHGEYGQACEVDSGGEQGEVGGDLGLSSDAGAAPAVAAAHQVPDLAFHFGSGGPVVRDPVRVALTCPGRGELLFVEPDADAAPGGCFGALLAQRAVRARVAETGGAGAGAVAPDRRGVPGRAGDGVMLEVDVELVLGEHRARGDRLLGLALGLDPTLFQILVERPGAIGAVAVDRRSVVLVGRLVAVVL